MTMDLMILIAQTIMVLILTGWLFTGVKDNIIHPSMNGVFVKAVLRLERLAEMYPDDFEMHKNRVIENEMIHKILFSIIVLYELVVCIALCVASVLMIMAIFGAFDIEQAKIVAMGASIGFTTIWAGFVILGNHFVYWMCHEWAQNTHIQLASWGMATMLILAIA